MRALRKPASERLIQSKGIEVKSEKYEGKMKEPDEQCHKRKGGSQNGKEKKMIVMKISNS